MPENERTQLIIQLRGFDARHYANTERYARQIDRVYKTACDEYARLGASLDAPEGEAVFSFDKYPRARKQAQGIMQRLAKKVESVITSGTQSEWLAATYKNDAFISSILRTSKLTKEEVEQYQGRNLEALNTFQRRKVEGMGLSERVWKQAEDMKAAIELGIDVAIGDGRDAQQLSRDLRSYLQEPKRLYRRVRDKGGVLRLSKAAKMYHPGQGVYRSSAKNAQRLARTEINMAYRESEFLRWQKLDFVVGIRVCLSNNHTIMNSKGEPVPLVDICDELWGDYPKTFKFVGWHPQCRCYVVPILSDYDEYNQDRANRLKAIVRGKAYKSLPSRRSVVDVPRKFREYIDSILERSKGWKSQPYYIRDNFVGGKIEGGLTPVIPTKTMNAVQPCTEFDARISLLKRWAYALGLDLSNVDSLRTAGNRAALLAELERLDEIGMKRQDAWIEAYNELSNFAKTQANGNKEITDICEKELRDNAVTTSHYYGNCISKLKAAFKNVFNKFTTPKNKSIDTVIKDIETKTKKVIDGSTLKASVDALRKREEAAAKAKSPQYSFIEERKGFAMQEGRVRDVEVYSTPSGVNIVIPKGKTITSSQCFTVEMVARNIAALPEELRATLKEVYLCDFFNKDDAYWAKAYKRPGFYSFATGGRGTVRFFKNKGNDKKLVRHGMTNGCSETEIPSTLRHECGHNTDRVLSKISESDIWKKAVEYDKTKNGGITAVTEYGKCSVAEDFADSVKLFIKDPEGFKKNFPARYAIMRQIFPTYTNE